MPQSPTRVGADTFPHHTQTQSIQLPFAMIPLLRLTCMSSIMGEFKTRGKTAILVSCLAVLVLIANFYLMIAVTDPNIEFQTKS